MFSRIANVPTFARKSSILYRFVATSSNTNSAAAAAPPATTTTTGGKVADNHRRYPHDAPERDFVNYPTLRQPEDCGKLRIGMFPDEWFQAMYPKTGVTGPYLLFWGAVATILSKEYFVYSVDSYANIAFLFAMVIGSKMAGPKVRAAAEKMRDENNDALIKAHESLTSDIKEKIADNQALTSMKDANKILHDAKRENVELQLEGLYRQRLHQVYSDVKKRLDYQVSVQNSFKRLEREQAINYIIGEVNKSIGPAQEKDAFQAGINHLKALSQRHSGTI